MLEELLVNYMEVHADDIPMSWESERVGETYKMK